MIFLDFLPTFGSMPKVGPAKRFKSKSKRSVKVGQAKRNNLFNNSIMHNILVVDNESLHTKEIGLLFPGQNITFCQYNKIPDTKNYDLIVLSWWSHYSVMHQPSPYKKEISLIRNSKVPILGICLWCQLIAHAFGSTVKKMSEKLVKEIEIRNNLDAKDYKVFEAHKYAIKTLWSEIEGISKSKYGYEIIRHKTRPLRWFQFHPEADMEHTEWKKILKEILDIIF